MFSVVRRDDQSVSTELACEIFELSGFSSSSGFIMSLISGVPGFGSTAVSEDIVTSPPSENGSVFSMPMARLRDWAYGEHPIESMMVWAAFLR